VSHRRPAALPHRVGVVPASAAARQRRSVDDALDARTAPATVVVGLGGVGKTQAAAGLVHRRWRDGAVDLVVWVTASARTSVVVTYAQAAVELTGVDDPYAERAAGAFLAWLAGSPHRWLVVLDDVTDPADVRGLFPPESATGQTVVTTRRRDAALTGGRDVLELDGYTPAEAVRYLRERLGGRTEGAAELAAELGHLPLALAQAAAYILDQDLTCAAYRDLLTDRGTRLADLEPDALPDDQLRGLAATWDLSVELAGRAGPAVALLRLASVLDPSGIPAAVFTALPTLDWITALRYAEVSTVDVERTRVALGADRLFTRPAPSLVGRLLRRPARLGPRLLRWSLARAGVTAADAATVTAAVSQLHLLSLVARAEEVVQVHALVQRVTADRATPGQRAGAVRVAADALADAWQRYEDDPPADRMFRANASGLLARHPDLLVTRDEVHPVVFAIGRSLGRGGLLTTACDHFADLYAYTREMLGRDHPDVLQARYLWAESRAAAGDSTGRTAELAEIVADHRRALGARHPRTFTVRARLAQASEPAAAVRELTALLRDMAGVLDPDDNQVFVTRVDLAEATGTAGDTAGAVAAFTQLRVDAERILGPDHPDTLRVRSHLVHWLRQAGDPAADRAAADLLQSRLRVLGPTHPDTLGSRYERQRALLAVGTADDAELAALRADVLRVLAPWELLAVRTQALLADRRGGTGDPAGAAEEYTALLADALAGLGAGHPDTITIRGKLAGWLFRAGDPAAAAARYEEQLQYLDAGAALTTQHRLAEARMRAGDEAGAAAALLDLLWVAVPVLDPETIPLDAITALLDDFLAVLGAEHPVVRAVQPRRADADPIDLLVEIGERLASRAS
jgi:NB-ARC domain/Tetratricopeptide repeat